MEAVVLITGALRAALVLGVYTFNVAAVVRLTLRKRCCVHSLTTGAVLLVGLFYLTSWAPFLAYGICNGSWLVLNSHRHCVLQHFVAAEGTAILMAVLAVRVFHDCVTFALRRGPLGSFATACLIYGAWLGPRLLCDAVSLGTEGNVAASALETTSYFMESLTFGNAANTSGTYYVGFLICVQSMSEPVLRYYVYHYFLVVLPLATIVLYSSIAVCLHAERQCSVVYTQRKSDRLVCPEIFVDMALYFNFFWLVLLRPLAVVHALYLQSDNLQKTLFMDFGSHVVLTFSAIFSPTIACCSRLEPDCTKCGFDVCASLKYCDAKNIPAHSLHSSKMPPKNFHREQILVIL